MGKTRWGPCGRVLIALLFAGWGGDGAAFRSVQVGDVAPPLDVRDLGGKEVRVDLGGRIAVLLFWRPGQAFSREAVRDLMATAEEFGGSGVSVVAVAERGSEAAAVRKEAEAVGRAFPLYLDVSGRAEEAYGVIVLPSTGIVGRDGRLKLYLPSRNSNYRAIIAGQLQVELGRLSGEEYATRMKALGEEIGGLRERAVADFKAGARLLRAGQADEAVRELSRALRHDPDYLEAHLELGYALLETGETPRAAKEFAEVLRRLPNSPSATVGAGIAAVRLGELDRGILLLKKGITLNPDPVRGYYELGRAYEAKGDLKEALHHYKWAVRKLIQGRR